MYLVYGVAALAVLIRSAKAEGALPWDGCIAIGTPLLLAAVAVIVFRSARDARPAPA